jgi:hypothetical protein
MIASNVEETRQVLERRPMHVVSCEGRLPDAGCREILCLVKANRPEVQAVVSSMLDAEIDEVQQRLYWGRSRIHRSDEPWGL